MVAALTGLSREDHEKIAAAIAAAQARTHARFALVVVPASDRYQLYPILWGAALALLVLCGIAIALPHLGVRLAAIIVLALFLVASTVLEWRPLRMAVVPERVKHAHARVLAHREFAVRILSHPEHGSGGVLFFVSVAERYAEVIADHVLHQAAGQAAWDRIVADFTAAAAKGRFADGFIQSAEACGALLEQHHPKG
jgi:putative membrane protein